MTLGYKSERSPENRKRDLDEADKQRTYMNSKSDTRRDHSFSTAHKAAEELRLEGNGSHDPVYEDARKNK